MAVSESYYPTVETIKKEFKKVIEEIESEEEHKSEILPTEIEEPILISTEFPSIKRIEIYKLGRKEPLSVRVEDLLDEIKQLKGKIGEIDGIQDKLRKIEEKLYSYSSMLETSINMKNTAIKKDIGVIAGSVVGSFILVIVGLFTNLFFYSVAGILLLGLTLFHAREEK